MDESESVPLLPEFCKGLDDSTEVVLKGCIIRVSITFVKEKNKKVVKIFRMSTFIWMDK